MTTLTAAMQQNGYRNIWIKSNKDELFRGNNDITLVIPFNKTLSTSILKIVGTKIVNLQYGEYDSKTDHNAIPPGHVVQIMARIAGLKIDIRNKPVIQLTPQELNQGQYFKNQIAIVNSGAGAAVHSTNKDWFPERFQSLVSQLKNKYDFVQLGTLNDPPLSNVLDLRGKTTLRESASILKSSILLISYAGFLMHLARAVDCRAVIIYGGRESPEQTGYKNFRNIYSDIPCSPCWLLNTCNYNKLCMEIISVDDVKEAVEKEIQLINEPLEPEILINGD
ncbi:glycosyltransferase family 9 protein [Mucilaginibacter pallidiroseus]|uniref:Glycosyltransferase family 9 protein n=1 Tax=Mucilaginibacter pallidiroseus TaxID=2599295 RepID=A0A563U2E9_9SPHI|nr:glycosyltransferase family 9 protein [Mucilaginibacter pallidiroseus]TWR25189.1 glycosyltransferase family 9 protein [Mucilaginibacter pallidiroseus]